MLNRPTNAVTKRAVMLAGAVLAMIALLLISSPAPNGIFAHPHDEDNLDDMRHIHYDENGTGMVRDFDSKDPEGSVIEWNVRGVDAADFAISSAGVLTFMDSPDYENPTDRARVAVDLNNDTDEDDPGEAKFAPIDNNYQITVSATEMSDALPAKRTDIALTVEVGNVDDPGELTLQWLQPEVDTPITATLTDPDTETDPVGEITGEAWTWHTSKAADPVVGNMFHWTVVDGQTGTSYTPAPADEGDYLWVRVKYTDPQGGSKEADAKSENPVRAAVLAGNGSPDFGDLTDTRTVPESTAVDDPVGDPVTATDTDNDTLTYELIADVSPNDGDDEFFDIDMATGQITVAQELDYDAVGDRTAGATASEYKVIVRATDPSGLADNITITITAENVNEAPMVTGRAELSVAEGITGAAYEGLPDAPAIGQPSTPTGQENEYVYEDPDVRDSIKRWTLEGDDAGAFDHSGRFEPRYLQFKEVPDFENPTDANSDNVYEVTLVATDTDPSGTGVGIGKVNVWVTVTNAEEEGEVVFTAGETAYLNEMLVAEVQDPDDKGGDLGEPYQGVHIVSWQWSRALTDADDTGFNDIVEATTNRYTPGEHDKGHYLRATATYTDPHSAADDTTTENEDERITADFSLKTESATTDNVVRLAPGPASVPTFDETGAVTREVAENTAPGGNVGAPVAAMGPETLVYSLEGTDAKYFNIDSGTAQITVGGDDPKTTEVTEEGTDPELDFDDPAKKQRFSVTVKVEVMGGDATQNAQVNVNIVVADVDELPTITDADVDLTDEDVDAAPMTTPTYLEINEDGAPNTAAVATYVGTDPEGGTITWDLRGADASFFTIDDDGVLKFRNSPDYEDPKDKAGANTATPAAMGISPDGTGMSDNVYNIVIRAITSRGSGDTGPAETVDITVAVTVTNVDEDGEVVISWLQPEAGTAITASLTDPDGDVAPEWQWEVSEAAANVLDIDNNNHWGTAPGEANLNSYIPAASDAAKYLRVTATVVDDEKTPRAMSAYPVQAEGGGRLNGSPDFMGEKVDRSVAETAEVRDKVGLPVTASLRPGDDSKDRLTYSLLAVTATDVADITGVDLPSGTDTAPADDLAAFNIDKATGQITLAAKLDFESRGTPDDGKYVVVVEVRDPSADTDVVPTIGYDFIVVVITATDVNEDPVLSGRPELTIEEINSGVENADNPEFDGNTAGDPPTVNVYGVVDEDRRAATNEWSLEGEDAGEFQLIGNVGRTLVFRNQPDYENPADDDGDNVYKVTIVTLDGHGGRAEFDVCIAVMNVNEDGKITLRDEDGNELVQPYAHGAITADLSDPDGGVTGVIWEWTSSPTSPNASWSTVSIGNAATYTPSNDDTSDFLRVTATYMDAKNDPPDDPTDRTAMATTEFSVLEVADQKRPPAFPAEYADGVEREVAENAPSTTFVGDPVPLAMDPDDPTGARLKYSLEDGDNGSEDTEFFELLSTADGPDDTAYTDDDTYSTQIRVKLHDMAHDLDHEDRNGMYEVVLKVTDDSDLEDTITVTIMVTDRNEAPSVPAEAEDGAVTTPGNNAPEFPSTETGMRSVPENTATDMPIGDPVAATDADTGDTLMYTLGGADMDSFTINMDTGQIMTAAALDFEMKASYAVEVTATDVAGASDTIEVTIMVTDKGLADSYDANEDGMIDSTEVLNAVEDYFNDVSGIDSERILDIVELYFSS